MRKLLLLLACLSLLPAATPPDACPVTSAYEIPAEAPVHLEFRKPRGDQITWIGDSYTYLSEYAHGMISAALPGVDIRCQSGKNFYLDLIGDAGGPSGITVLREMLENGEPVREYVVFALGANNRELDCRGVNYIDVLMELLGPARTVILVKPRTFDNTFRTVNRQIDEAAGTYPNIVVADWAAAVQGRTRQYFNPERDTLHPVRAGCQLWVDTVCAALPECEPQPRTDWRGGGSWPFRTGLLRQQTQ